jgi:hypothetical protein
MPCTDTALLLLLLFSNVLLVAAAASLSIIAATDNDDVLSLLAFDLTVDLRIIHQIAIQCTADCM